MHGEHNVTRALSEDGTEFRVRLKISVAEDDVLGPGKADLLEHIDACGSISEAARRMQMSYRRGWLLTDELNRTFAQPLVTTARGGSHGGGARLTAHGRRVLETYRTMEARALAAVGMQTRAFLELLGREG